MSYQIDKHYITYRLFDSHPEMTAFSTTRHGGVSDGTYATFNCTIHGGDSPEHVNRNLQLLSGSLPNQPDRYIIPRQCHKNTICFIEDKDTEYNLEDVDAVVTNIPKVCVCVSTADCVPILLYDSAKHVVAAVHSGWRGTVIRIIETTIDALKQRYDCNSSDILACIGPSISLAAFEVGNEVYDTFHHAGFDMRLIARHYNKWHIDLWEANRQILLSKGVLDKHIEVSGICTYYNNEDFFSARRLGKKSGRILNGIMLL
ncbi:MAG: peptidoglycan editing factor PgeF [Phocaeicola sp.]|uniref:peptidoglycan editing factor PgeF n=1 Tax=Phocaeicola TaxID=909656 RepID=UPI00234F41D0|nr:peptidoglycan editing factor PgeF [Phocaeicola oris]MCE2615528.1 peptidoglycan editing factor PgeF [Phocaeicola oris]